jgi:putative membrane protein
MKTKQRSDWFLRVLKGGLIGSGFILPGISGGALAAVFGLYEKLIQFLANPFKAFKENFLFFLPVGIGGLLGVFLLSFGVSFLLGSYESIVLWFFVGAIVGTVPQLWREAGREGRTSTNVAVAGVAFAVMLAFLLFGAPLFTHIQASFGAWVLAGIMIGLGLVIPGLSPSNFLIYLGLYKGMSDGIKNVDFGVLIPLVLGLILVVALLSKVMAALFKSAYATLFHIIFGIVLASTVMIIPTDYAGFTWLSVVASVMIFVAGTWLGWWMATLEEKVKA